MKNGISIVMLVIVIVILAILATVGVFTADSAIKTSDLNYFATNMSTIQNAVTSYYATRGTLPVINNSTVYTKSALLAEVGEIKANTLSTEIDLNGDTNMEFYIVDVEKLGLENLTFNITATSNNLIVNSEGTHVYLLDGYEINGELYFSITKDMR